MSAELHVGVGSFGDRAEIVFIQLLDDHVLLLFGEAGAAESRDDKFLKQGRGRLEATERLTRAAQTLHEDAEQCGSALVETATISHGDVVHSVPWELVQGCDHVLVDTAWAPRGEWRLEINVSSPGWSKQEEWRHTRSDRPACFFNWLNSSG